MPYITLTRHKLRRRFLMDRHSLKGIVGRGGRTYKLNVNLHYILDRFFWASSVEQPISFRWHSEGLPVSFYFKKSVKMIILIFYLPRHLSYQGRPLPHRRVGSTASSSTLQSPVRANKGGGKYNNILFVSDR